MSDVQSVQVEVIARRGTKVVREKSTFLCYFDAIVVFVLACGESMRFYLKDTQAGTVNGKFRIDLAESPLFEEEDITEMVKTALPEGVTVVKRTPIVWDADHPRVKAGHEIAGAQRYAARAIQFRSPETRAMLTAASLSALKLHAEKEREHKELTALL